MGAHISGENPIKRDEEGNHEDDVSLIRLSLSAFIIETYIFISTTYEFCIKLW